MSNIPSRVLLVNIIGPFGQMLGLCVGVEMVMLLLLIMRLKPCAVVAVTARGATRDLDMIIRRARTLKGRTIVNHLHWGMSCRWRGLPCDGGIILGKKLMMCVSN